jgi:plastocyanin
MRTLITLPLMAALTACGGGESTPALVADAPKADAPATDAKPAAAPASGGYSEQDAVADAGIISGTVTYTGTKTDKMVTPDKDTETCGHEHPERAAGALVVAEGKLANAVVFLDNVAAGKKWAADSVTLDNIDCNFVPHVTVAKKGGKLIAKNSDPVLHNTNLTLVKGNKKIANIALPQKDQESTPKSLKKAGLVNVACDAHEWMQGYVFVATSPYAAVTDAAGAFSMADVPAGEYTAKVWHEMLGEQEAKVKVDAGGTASLDFAYADEAAAGEAPAQ